MLYEFFIVAKELVLLVEPNNLWDGMMFRGYIINIMSMIMTRNSTAVRI
jgi:hypothetical protein